MLRIHKIHKITLHFWLFLSHLQVCATGTTKYKYLYTWIYLFLSHTPEDGYGIAKTCSVILCILCVLNIKIQSSE
jgi:hypothetical protein